jgi:hypothetical protein
VNEIAQLVTMEVSIRMHWIDPRVRLSNFAKMPINDEYILLNPRLARHLWVPDLFIDQAKELREPTFHVLPASLRIYRFIDCVYCIISDCHNLFVGTVWCDTLLGSISTWPAI